MNILEVTSKKKVSWKKNDDVAEFSRREFSTALSTIIGKSLLKIFNVSYGWDLIIYALLMSGVYSMYHVV